MSTRVPVVAALTLLMSALHVRATSAETASSFTVLTIHSGAENFPANPYLDAGIREALGSRPALRIDNFSEYLEEDLFPDNDASLAFKDYLQRKYRGRH